ncbi:MAG: hypothetical protein ABUL62_31725 [Myxococcales bacterium]
MDLDDIQGIVLHGYRSLPFASYHLLGFGAGQPRQLLARLVSEISSCAEPRAEHRLQLALTASGLRALGLPLDALAQFSREFRQGMAHPERAAALGDSADEAPEAWELGGPKTEALDGLCMTFASTREGLALLGESQARLCERFGVSLRTYEAEPLAAPRPASSSASVARKTPRKERVPLGELVLGERDVLGERQRGPFVPVKYGTRPMPDWVRRERALDFGQNGSYLVLRKLSRVAAAEPGTETQRAAVHDSQALGSEDSRPHHLWRRSRALADGLWFMALNANIRRQFEYVQQGRCHEPGWAADESRQLRLRGGAYFFLPGIRALNYLAEPGA